MSRYSFIAACTEHRPVQLLCRVLGMSSAGSASTRVRPAALASPPPGPCPASAGPVIPNNAQAEAGWSTLKTELLPSGSPFASLEKARLEVAHYLDTYFNLDRRHFALGYRSPHQFEHDLKINLP